MHQRGYETSHAIMSPAYFYQNVFIRYVNNRSTLADSFDSYNTIYRINERKKNVDISTARPDSNL